MTDAEAREVVSDLLVRAGFDLFSDTIDQLTDAIVQLWKARGGTAEETLRELTQMHRRSSGIPLYALERSGTTGYCLVETLQCAGALSWESRVL